MKTFTIYANCQGTALSKMLFENSIFRSQFNIETIAPVQTLEPQNVEAVKRAIGKFDVVIYQHISSYGKLKDFATTQILDYVKDDAILISFPSMYFNGYFPHLDTLDEKTSILNLVHDYFIIYGFVKDLTEEDLLAKINSEDLYPANLSAEFVKSSLDNLRKREVANNVDIKVSDYIEENYRDKKLFNQFNHPRRQLFSFVSNKIFEKLGVASEEKLESMNDFGYLDVISTPVYPSTYKNLSLTFVEDLHYGSVSGKLPQDEIVRRFYKFYGTLEKDFLLKMVEINKNFVMDLI